jgi:hypothetical protein
MKLGFTTMILINEEPANIDRGCGEHGLLAR